MRLILASGSKSRKDILDILGLDYEVITSKIDEFSNQKVPDEYVKELSLAKAKSVAEQIEDKVLIVSADTILFKNGKFYEKPKTKEEAAKNIKELMGEKFQSFTGVTILDKYQNKTISYSASVDIKFRDNITDEEIEWYAENEPNVLKCCGFTPQG